jgi:rhodanese-related sulfurtransferase
VNIPHTELGARLSEVQSENGVALYCMVGPRARLGEKTLQEAGVVKVFHLEGGLAAWQEAGLPVEQGAD